MTLEERVNSDQLMHRREGFAAVADGAGRIAHLPRLPASAHDSDSRDNATPRPVYSLGVFGIIVCAVDGVKDVGIIMALRSPSQNIGIPCLRLLAEYLLLIIGSMPMTRPKSRCAGH